MFAMVKNVHNNNNSSRLTSIAIIGSLIMVISGICLSYNYVQTKKVLAFDHFNDILSENTTETVQEVSNITEVEEVEEAEEHVDNINYEYIGTLLIPKINLKKGFVAKDSPYNNVDQNILVVSVSDYPDVVNGNLILAGHSGTGYKAFFRDLYKLQLGDTAQIIYQNKQYDYRITKIYKQQKSGKIAIYRDYNKTTLTLVTCSKDDNQHQTIYILELVNQTST